MTDPKELRQGAREIIKLAKSRRRGTKMRGHKDANQDTLVELWTGIGCLWIPCNQYPQLGFDGLLIGCDGRTNIVEIKTSANYHLTPTEKKRKEQVETAGGVYNIIWNDRRAYLLAQGDEQPADTK